MSGFDLILARHGPWRIGKNGEQTAILHEGGGILSGGQVRRPEQEKAIAEVAPLGLSESATRMTAPFDQSEAGLSRWTAQTVGMNAEILDRMERAVAKVRERLLRATAALNQAGVPYAVVGGNAVAS